MKCKLPRRRDKSKKFWLYQCSRCRKFRRKAQMSELICKRCDKTSGGVLKKRRSKKQVKFTSRPKLKGITVIKAQDVPAYRKKRLSARCYKSVTTGGKRKITDFSTIQDAVPSPDSVL